MTGKGAKKQGPRHRSEKKQRNKGGKKPFEPKQRARTQPNVLPISMAGRLAAGSLNMEGKEWEA